MMAFSWARRRAPLSVSGGGTPSTLSNRSVRCAASPFPLFARLLQVPTQCCRNSVSLFYIVHPAEEFVKGPLLHPK